LLRTRDNAVVHTNRLLKNAARFVLLTYFCCLSDLQGGKDSGHVEGYAA
jgi:hypothetical protein